MFWGILVIFLPSATTFAKYEQQVLSSPVHCVGMASFLGAAALGLYIFNRYQARSAVLNYEELPLEVITTLGLTLK